MTKQVVIMWNIHFVGLGVDHTIGTDASFNGFLRISNSILLEQIHTSHLVQVQEYQIG